MEKVSLDSLAETSEDEGNVHDVSHLSILETSSVLVGESSQRSEHIVFLIVGLREREESRIESANVDSGRDLRYLTHLRDSFLSLLDDIVVEVAHLL